MSAHPACVKCQTNAHVPHSALLLNSSHTLLAKKVDTHPSSLLVEKAPLQADKNKTAATRRPSQWLVDLIVVTSRYHHRRVGLVLPGGVVQRPDMHTYESAGFKIGALLYSKDKHTDKNPPKTYTVVCLRVSCGRWYQTGERATLCNLCRRRRALSRSMQI